MKTGYLEAGKMVINSVDPEGVPGGSVVKNPPANAGDMSSIPIWEDPICLGAMKIEPVALEPDILCSTSRSLCTKTREAATLCN